MIIIIIIIMIMIMIMIMIIIIIIIIIIMIIIIIIIKIIIIIMKSYQICSEIPPVRIFLQFCHQFVINFLPSFVVYCNTMQH